MKRICDLCNACHDPRCPLGGEHELDCCGLQALLVWRGGVFCLEVLEAGQADRSDASGLSWYLPNPP